MVVLLQLWLCVFDRHVCNWALLAANRISAEGARPRKLTFMMCLLRQTGLSCRRRGRSKGKE
eukprot:7021739-Alexandrium_andersonii.AAC.1